MANRKLHPRLAAINGAAKKNPARYKDTIQERTEGIGNPPGRLSAAQKRIWRELKKNAVEGLLTVSDREAFAYLCRLVDLARTEEVNAAMARELRMYFGVFGMTPAERARIPGKSGDSKPQSGPGFGKVS